MHTFLVEERLASLCGPRSSWGSHLGNAATMPTLVPLLSQIIFLLGLIHPYVNALHGQLLHQKSMQTGPSNPNSSSPIRTNKNNRIKRQLCESLSSSPTSLLTQWVSCFFWKLGVRGQRTLSRQNCLACYCLWKYGFLWNWTWLEIFEIMYEHIQKKI